MELFYSSDIVSDTVRLDREESGHCVKVLRHKAGDAVSVIDGRGTLFHCTLLDADPREAVLRIDSCEESWGALPYRLTLGICPTKNADRFEWAVEKATEFGASSIVPLIGERSERRVFKPERARRIALAATKQSLKASIPAIPDALPVRDFLAEAREIHLAQQCASCDPESMAGVAGEPISPHLPQQSAPECGEMHVAAPGEFSLRGHNVPGGRATSHDNAAGASGRQLRLIACCFDGPDWQRVSMRSALEAAFAPDGPEESTSRTAGAGNSQALPANEPGRQSATGAVTNGVPDGMPEVTVLVGPEGDFSPEEVEAARAAGFVPVHLGTSRLRTETAAVAAAAFVYYHFM